MERKITAVIMSLAMGAAFMTGCSGTGNTAATKNRKRKVRRYRVGWWIG
ncbi:MAG: hypothetical protein ACLUAR_12505 [Pilosibacter sp.]